MSETKDISRKRLAEFFAARLRARVVDPTKTPRPRGGESGSIASSRPEQRATPVSES